MDSAPSKAARPILIADHLWRLFEEMARSMGSEPEALINQAMFIFARANGFEPSRPPPPVAGRNENLYASSAVPPTDEDTPCSADLPAPSPLADMSPIPLTTELIALMPEQVVTSSPAEAHGWVAERVPSLSGDDEGAHRRMAERVLQTAAHLEQMLGTGGEAPAASSGNGAASGSPGAIAALVILSEDGQRSTVAKDRFLIGRGKHCDYVISSGKVSREHAVIVRDGSEYFIEDLGSSNGTWFNKQRIKRQKIADGDEYFICSDRIRLLIR